MRRLFAYTVVMGLVALTLFGAACGEDEPSDKLQVVTTLELVADFVRGVGGDEVEVSALIPAGAEPHTFEASDRKSVV